MAADREFLLSRLFDAPRELVFEAWTDPKQMARWWGPKGFTNPVCEMDVRPGGPYRIVMRSPEGAEYPLKGIFHEIVKPVKIVFTDNWEEHPADWHELLLKYGADRPAREALNTVTFEDRDGKTLLTIRTLFESVAVRDAMVKMGMNEGWSQSLDRLEELLAGA
jgi:uncharacterized protein YndB with AHSA1/START domain